MNVEILLSDFQSIVDGFFRIFIFQQLMSIVFCEAVFLLLDCQLFAFTLNCFTVHVYEWYGNRNDPMGIPWE